MNRGDVAISIWSTNAVDCITLAIVHNAFKDTMLDELKRITDADQLVSDVHGSVGGEEAKKGVRYRTL